MYKNAIEHRCGEKVTRREWESPLPYTAREAAEDVTQGLFQESMHVSEEEGLRVIASTSHDRSALKRLSDDAVIALSGAGICTPEKGYVAEPQCLRGDIQRLARERDEAVAAHGETREALARAHAVLRDTLLTDHMSHENSIGEESYPPYSWTCRCGARGNDRDALPHTADCPLASLAVPPDDELARCKEALARAEAGEGES